VAYILYSKKGKRGRNLNTEVIAKNKSVILVARSRIKAPSLKSFVWGGCEI